MREATVNILDSIRLISMMACLCSNQSIASWGDDFAQQSYLKASNTSRNDHFGEQIAISGDTMVISAVNEGSSATGVNGNQQDSSMPFAGAVYVFRRVGNSWAQEAYIKASNTNALDSFGYAIAISGDTLVVGAPDEDSTATGINGNQLNNEAEAVGAAYVYTRDNGVWAQDAYLKASNAEENDKFGSAVAINGNTIAVGALNESSNATGVNGDQNNNGSIQSGAVYLFQRNSGVWVQQTYAKPFDTGALQHFGESLALSESHLIIGSSWKSNNGLSNAGVVYVYEFSGTQWLQAAYLTASTPGDNDNFGHSLGLHEDTLVIGARREFGGGVGVNPVHDDTAQYSGAVYVFKRLNGDWVEQAYVKPSNTNEQDQFGWSVSVAKDKFVVGAWRESSDALGVNGNQINNAALQSGAAYVFKKTNNQWHQTAYVKASNTDAGDNFGFATAITENLLVVGATRESSGSVGVNGPQDNNDVLRSGAVYVFTGDLIFMDDFE